LRDHGAQPQPGGDRRGSPAWGAAGRDAGRRAAAAVAGVRRRRPLERAARRGGAERERRGSGTAALHGLRVPVRADLGAPAGGDGRRAAPREAAGVSAAAPAGERHGAWEGLRGGVGGACGARAWWGASPGPARRPLFCWWWCVGAPHVCAWWTLAVV